MAGSLTVELTQQTPMIHFQYSEPGATLRGSELKPKLDRFLIEQLGGIAKAINQHKDWFIHDSSFKQVTRSFKPNSDMSIDEHLALDYKVRITTDGRPKVSEEIAPSFFGNMGTHSQDHPRDKVQSVKYGPGQVHLTLFSRCEGLMKYLVDNPELIELFFLLNNFGTRQSKGFGSFTVSGSNSEPEELISDYYRDFLTGLSAYELVCDEPTLGGIRREISQELRNQEERIRTRIAREGRTADLQSRLNKAIARREHLLGRGNDGGTLGDPLWWVWMTYGLLKSGFNYTSMNESPRDYLKGFALSYFHRVRNLSGRTHHRNDKAFIKQRILRNEYILKPGGSPPDSEFDSGPQQGDFRFIRALLGLATESQWYSAGRGRTWFHAGPNRPKGKNPEGSPSVLASGVDMTDGKPKIARIPSPILFSVADNSRVFMLPRRIPRAAFGAEFEISYTIPHSNFHPTTSGLISTPSENELDWPFFLKYFSSAFNHKSDPWWNGITLSSVQNLDLRIARALELRPI